MHACCRLRAGLAQIKGVIGVHELHVWNLVGDKLIGSVGCHCNIHLFFPACFGPSFGDVFKFWAACSSVGPGVQVLGRALKLWAAYAVDCMHATLVGLVW
jgi:hypothetical protein